MRSADDDTGLCGSCRWAEPVESSRGSRFLRCLLAERDAAYAKYPRLPRRVCAGHRPRRDDPVSERSGPV